MGNSVTGKAFSVKELFEKSFYQIDYYQREYAWSADDVRTLVSDLTNTGVTCWPTSRSTARTRTHRRNS